MKLEDSNSWFEFFTNNVHAFLSYFPIFKKKT